MPPSAMTQSKPKRESMLSRSKRIIGKQLKNDPQEDGQAAQTSLTQDNSSKRRSQVLKAQRAHRRRTQNYILELEKEVLRLRQREAEMVAKLDFQHSNPGQEHQSQKIRTVTVDLSEYEHIEAGYPCSKAALGIEPVFPDSRIDNLAQLADSATKDMNHTVDELFQTDAQNAIDFILDLERPCLSHIKYDLTTKLPTPFGEPTLNYGRSHSCTASATIIQSYPNTDWAKQKIHLPQQIVESLLTNSKALPLGPEMTPVQVWDLLTDIDKAERLSVAKLAFFKEQLAKYMRCNAFGTSIPIESLKKLMNFCFPWYDATYLRDVQVPVAEPELNIMNEAIGGDWNQFF